MFGRGDHMLDHFSHALYTFPLFFGMGARRVRPVDVDDLVAVLVAALVEGRLPRQTVAVVGPTEIGFDDAARLVARVLGKRRPVLRVPIGVHYAVAGLAEWAMTVPLVSRAQVRILDEEVVAPIGASDHLPEDLVPTTAFDEVAIRAGLPDPGPYQLEDLRWCNARRRTRPVAEGGSVPVLIFDGDCGFCTSTARWAERGFHRGERAEPWQRIGPETLAGCGLGLDDVVHAAWWVEPDRVAERGHRAAGKALQAGGGWRYLVGTFVLTPPTSWLAAAVYRLAVRWRYRLPGGTPACRLEP